MTDFIAAQEKFAEIAQHTNMPAAPDQWNLAAGLADMAAGLADVSQRLQNVEALLARLAQQLSFIQHE